MLKWGGFVGYCVGIARGFHTEDFIACSHYVLPSAWNEVVAVSLWTLFWGSWEALKAFEE